MHELVKTIQNEQRSRWHRGERVPIEAYLERYPPLKADAVLAVDAIYGEVMLREAFGETPTAAEYVRRFPEFAEPLQRQFRLHECLRVDILQPADTPRALLTTVESTLPQGPRTSAARAVPFPTIPGYEILGRLGRGGRGVVYRARQLRLNRVVALKMIRHDEDANDANGLALFHREAAAVARLEHPNIIRLYEFDEHAGRPYFTMELAAGGSLEKRLSAGPLEPRAAAALVETLARAMHVVHRQEQGIVHRDLKPANILLAADGTPKIADFGLAKRLDGGDSLFSSGTIVGTAGYMAPEQAVGRKDIGPATDIYSLGAILYECLTGRPAFKGVNWYDTLNRVRGQEPIAPRRLNRELPRDLETICLKCLAKDPRQRYASAEELADRLRLFLKGKAVPDRPPRRPAKLRQALRFRHPQSAAAVLLAALVAGLLAANSYLDPDPTKREPADSGRARRDVEFRLARGLTYEFKGNEPLPGPFRQVLRDPCPPPQVNRAEHCFSYQTFDAALLELANPHLDGYQFSAEVRHDEGSGLSAVGIYFGHRHRQGLLYPEHDYCTVSFGDLGRLAEAARDKNGRKRNFVELEYRRLVMRPGLPLPHDMQLGALLYSPLPLTAFGTQLPLWRKLMVRVTPKRIEALWAENGKEPKTFCVIDTTELNERMKKRSDGRGGRLPDANVPPFSPRDGLGLYLLGAKASFRHIKLEPLKGGK